MRIQQLAFFAAAATLSLSAFADPTIAPAPNHADAAMQKAVHENTSYRLTADEAQRMRGTFELDDGRKMVVTSKRNRLFAELDGKSEELVPVAKNTFVAPSARLRVAFDQVPFGQEVTVQKIN